LNVFEVLSLTGTRKILAALKVRNRMRYSELAEAVGYSTTTTRALKAMESSSYVKKEVLNEPYRPVVYWLTEKGKRLSDFVVEIERLDKADP
jgi:DNA-binding HxlR family transcriptional regulator